MNLLINLIIITLQIVCVPVRVEAMISKLNNDFWKAKKMTQIDEILRQCLGLFIEVTTLSSSKTKGDTCSFNIEIINRSMKSKI